MARGIAPVVAATVALAAVFAACANLPEEPERPVAVPPSSAPERPNGDGGSRRPGGALMPVLRVVDGDTIHVLREGRDLTIRLIGIDTPEVDWYGGRAECFGARAGRFLMGFLDDERVALEFDQDRVDPYDRTLAYVYLADGRMVNELLVRKGFAVVTIYEPNDRHGGRLRAAETDARSRAAGLWSACD